MHYMLKRERDGAGDSGLMSDLYIFNEDGTAKEVKHNARPEVGGAMVVGSYYSRTMDDQDFWTTTLVEEILEESDNEVKFRTQNSIYEWKQS